MYRFALIILIAILFNGCSSGSDGRQESALPSEASNNLFEGIGDEEASDETGFIGLWESAPAIIIGDSSRTSRIEFRESYITVTMECRYDNGEVVYATVTGQARLESNGNYTVLEQKVVESDPVMDPECTAEINPGTIQLVTIRNGRIAAQTPGPNPQQYYFKKISN